MGPSLQPAHRDDRSELQVWVLAVFFRRPGASYGPVGAAAQSMAMLGSWPQARMNLKRSSRAMFVVAVFSSGWQLIVSCFINSSSKTRRTRCVVSLMTAKAVTDPGGTPSASSSRSGLPKLKRPARTVLDSALSSTRVEARAPTRNSEPSSSLRKRFLVCAPDSWRSSRLLSATVNSGSCSTVLVSMPSSASRSNRSWRDAGIGRDSNKNAGRPYLVVGPRVANWLRPRIPFFPTRGPACWPKWPAVASQRRHRRRSDVCYSLCALSDRSRGIARADLSSGSGQRPGSMGGHRTQPREFFVGRLGDQQGSGKEARRARLQAGLVDLRRHAGQHQRHGPHFRGHVLHRSQNGLRSRRRPQPRGRSEGDQKAVLRWGLLAVQLEELLQGRDGREGLNCAARRAKLRGRLRCLAKAAQLRHKAGPPLSAASLPQWMRA